MVLCCLVFVFGYLVYSAFWCLGGVLFGFFYGDLCCWLIRLVVLLVVMLVWLRWCTFC